MVRWILIGTVLMLFTSACQAMRDPTQPIDMDNLSRVQNSGYQVSMIVVSYDKQVAVINGSFAQTGDIIGNGKVLNIRPNKVIIENIASGEVTVVPLIETTVRLYETKSQ